MSTITGSATGALTDFLTISADGQPIDEAESGVTAQQSADNFARLKSGAHTFGGIKTFAAAPVFAAGAHVSQTQAITADGAGCTLAGTWTASGVWTFDEGPNLVKSPELEQYVLTVSGATNATPIEITVTSNHGLVDGQQVVVNSVGGNTNANGTWVANVTGAAKFKLLGSAGNAGYTAATGFVDVTAEIKLSSARTVTRVLMNAWNDGNTWTDSAWSADANGTFVAINGTPTTQVQHIGYEIDVPQGANIISATIYIQPNGGHAAFPGGAPGTLPNVKIVRFTLASGSVTTLATQVDPNTGSAGAYEAYGGIAATIGTDEFADRSRFRYMAILSTETGANALDGTRVFAGAVTYTTSFLEQV